MIPRPYHYLGLETIHTIMTAAVEHRPTGAVEYAQSYDVVVRARHDLKTGQTFGILRGGNRPDYEELTQADLEAFIAPASAVADDAPAPLHLLDGNPLAVDVQKGMVVTCGMVQRPADSVIWPLRGRQDKELGTGSV